MPVSTFVNGLIAALQTPFAQKKINGNDIGNLSRVFDEFKLPGRTNAALYEQLMSELGKNALTIELDDVKEQDALGKKITDEMMLDEAQRLAQQIVSLCPPEQYTEEISKLQSFTH